MYCGDEIRAVVVDFGAFSTKLGESGEGNPKRVFSTEIGATTGGSRSSTAKANVNANAGPKNGSSSSSSSNAIAGAARLVDYLRALR